jgi:DNA mismatch repair protein MSH3
MVAALLQDAYVPNDIVLTDDMRLMLITGPNMGGKSSFMRMVALHLVMGQMGCYVPAARAHLRVFDGIYTRMGAADEIQRGMSTFMVELLDAAQTLSAATPQSLVIMDELGRGTSTYDGYAIAYATACALVEDVCHLVHVRWIGRLYIRQGTLRGMQIGCATLFATHYPLLGQLSDVYGEAVVVNRHMGFMELADKSVTFLYTLAEGLAHCSYGLNVARLADIPASVLEVAAIKAHELEMRVSRRAQLRELLGILSHSQTASLLRPCLVRFRSALGNSASEG